MLFDFHKSQNARKPGSIHATYLVYGIRSNNGPGKDDGDVEMSSSLGDADSIAEHVPTTGLTLVREEDLNGMLGPVPMARDIH